jgi:glyceraldehyde-3-phosphate dehydrogenase (ferredoxin)
MNLRKIYEPYHTMGPLCGIFDQRVAAEKINSKADSLGFDGNSVGGVSFLANGLSR